MTFSPGSPARSPLAGPEHRSPQKPVTCRLTGTLLGQNKLLKERAACPRRRGWESAELGSDSQAGSRPLQCWGECCSWPSRGALPLPRLPLEACETPGGQGPHPGSAGRQPKEGPSSLLGGRPLLPPAAPCSRHAVTVAISAEVADHHPPHGAPPSLSGLWPATKEATFVGLTGTGARGSFVTQGSTMFSYILVLYGLVLKHCHVWCLGPAVTGQTTKAVSGEERERLPGAQA